LAHSALEKRLWRRLLLPACGVAWVMSIWESGTSGSLSVHTEHTFTESAERIFLSALLWYCL